MAARLEGFEVFSDGSGAPAAVHYGRPSFAFNMLGELKYHAIGGGSAGRVERKIAVSACKKAYEAALAAAVGPEWREKNRAMYADLLVSK